MSIESNEMSRGGGKADPQEPSFFWLIAEDGWPVLALAGLLTILLTILFVPLGTFSLGLLVWLAHVLRIPKRKAPKFANAIVAPADGRVIEIVTLDMTESFGQQAALRITIRTSLSDVQLHVAPIDGRITDNFSIPGLFNNFEDMVDDNKEEVMAKTKNQVFDLLKKTIRPEFLNRIDETIMFTPLTREDIRGIVDLQFVHLQKLLAEQDIKITATDEALDWLGQLGYDPQFGARPLKRVMQKKVLNELSKQILAGTIANDSHIVLDMFDNHMYLWDLLLWSYQELKEHLQRLLLHHLIKQQLYNKPLRPHLYQQ